MLSIIDFALVGVFAVVYAWIFYNLPILAAGVRNLRKCKQNPQAHHDVESRFLPSFSIVIPVKNEAKIVGRLLTALSNLNYPADKVEIVVVEDGSVDETFEVCSQFASAHYNVKVLQRPFSNGKSSALNYGIENSGGEVIAVFDADNVPARDALLEAAKYFDDPAVAAVQGRNLSINSQENMLTQFLSYEEAVWCEAYLRGKDALGLFVHLKGSCQFIRRDVLNRLEGFDENMLSEDMELSARLTENGYKIRYGGDVCAWQESPANLKTLFKQRTRWFRGTMEVAFKYGKLIAKLNRKNLDVEATLFGPFIVIASLLSYLVASGAFFTAFPFDILWRAFMYFSVLTTTLMIFVCGFALIYVSRPKRLRSLLWLPFVYSYWCLQAFISLYAALLILFRRPKRWLRTEKKGVVANSDFVLETEQIYA
jgi:cellulose synthase/poly-beta-1,6-N-acetylglucosamine synthase-like glycosyltransferase